MTESKKIEVYDRVRSIISGYEVEGITKNRLIQILQEKGVATRKTVYGYWNDLLQRKIIEERRVGVQQKKYFPTKENQSLTKISDKINIVKKLLSFVDSHSTLGDCFATSKQFSIFPELTVPTTPIQINLAASTFVELIEREHTFSNKKMTIEIYSHMARHDLIKELPSFLIYYLNDPLNNYTEQVKEEALKLVVPLVVKCLDLMQRDYSYESKCSKQFKTKIRSTLNKHEVVSIIGAKGLPLSHVQTEFLKILGRYYFCISRSFSKNMKFDSSKEQALISSFVRSFFDVNYINGSDHEIISENIYLLNSEWPTHNRVKAYELIRNTIVGKLTQFFIELKYYDDPIFYKNYWINWLMSLGMFSEFAKRLLELSLKEK